MQELNMNGRPQCLLYSMAMLLDCSPHDLSYEVGHSGKPPRGYHFVEFNKSAVLRGWIIQYYPIMPVNDGFLVWDEDEAKVRMQLIMAEHRCVVLGQNQRLKGHAICWNKTYGIDPADGERLKNLYSRISPQALLIRFPQNRIIHPGPYVMETVSKSAEIHG